MIKAENNLKDFDKWLNKLVKDKEESTKEVIEEYTELICDLTKKRAPYDTGTLKSSIDTFYSTDGFTGYAYTNIIYAKYTEFGTVYIPKHGYFERAYNKYYDDFVKALVNKLQH